MHEANLRIPASGTAAAVIRALSLSAVLYFVAGFATLFMFDTSVFPPAYRAKIFLFSMHLLMAGGFACLFWLSGLFIDFIVEQRGNDPDR